MSDEVVRLRPRHLATVWGTAVGQIADLAIASWKAMAGMAYAERDIPADALNAIRVVSPGGAVAELRAGELKGETFGDRLPGDVVVFTPGPATTDGGVALLIATVDETRSAKPIRGDIYRGEVVDEHGLVVAHLALDAGS